MHLLDGKKLSAEIRNELALEYQKIKSSGGKIPHLAAILVGNNVASQMYVKSKVKACEQIGFKSTLIHLQENVSEKELLQNVFTLNNDNDVDGFIVQLPLPKHISEQKIIENIFLEKDVDGFHPENIGRMALNLPCYIPATPFGILQMIERYKIETSGKNCVVIGRSHIVGLPMNILMSRNAYPGNCTVTVCHSKTKNLKDICKQADILIAAIGKPEFVTSDMVKDGAVVIDVGITRVPQIAQIKNSCNEKKYKIVGDVKFDEVSPKCSFITPVPGGVGLMTVTALLMNTLKASRREIY
ncbi:MAG: tetrahydrofolate dehydrogenase/cyclohydrolase catalytic domain-containing protein [Bacteroidota bacterium]